MRLRHVLVLTALLAAVALSAPVLRKSPIQAPPVIAQTPDSRLASIRIIFGELQSTERTYDGSIQVSQGKIIALLPFRFGKGDTIAGANSWKVTTKRVAFDGRNGRPNSVAGGGPAQNIVPAGITATLVAPEAARITVNTSHGRLEFALNELSFGRMRTSADGDITVERVPTVSKVNEEETGEQHDYPALVETSKGEMWFAWQAYKDRGDHIYVRRRAAASWSAPERVTEGKGDLLRPELAEDAAGRIHVIWCEREGEDWNLMERRFDGSSWSPRISITSGTGTNIHHRVVSDSRGNLHMIWVAYSGGKSYAAYSRFAGEKWSARQDVGGPSVWSPDISVDTAGNAYAAWDGYRSGNYDIFLRRIAADGTLGETQQVTKSPRFQAHPSVAVDPQGRPWLAWDESGVNWGKDWTHDSPYRSTLLYTDRAVSVAVLDGGEWKHAKADPNVSLPSYMRRYVQLPRICFDASGRLWMMFQCRTSVTNNREDYWASNGRWDAFVTSLSADAWSGAVMLPQSTCRIEGPFGIYQSSGGGIQMCWATDNRPFVAPGFGAATAGQYEVYTAQMRQEGSSRPPELARLAESIGAPPISVHPEENADVTRVRGYRIQPAGKELRILRGDFHRHTDISNDGAGDGSVEDYYRYMIDCAQMDTGIIADHNMGGDVEYNWWRTEKSYDVYHLREGFTPLFGYERSVNYPNGHRNIVFDHRGVRTLPISPEENMGAVNSGPILYPYLRQNRGICMEHSLATDQGTDWRDNDPELEPLVEIYQGYHANYEYEGAPLAETANYLVRIHGGYRPAGFFWNALAKGLRLGVQSSSDHISTHVSYAMIYSPSGSRRDIVQAMRDRHAYGATDNIVLDVQARDGDQTYMMGDIFDTRTKAVQFKIKVMGTDRIARLDVVKNNSFAFTREGEGKEMTLDYADQSPRKGENYYYVRVQQIDRNMAWSSPIWVRYN